MEILHHRYDCRLKRRAGARGRGAGRERTVRTPCVRVRERGACRASAAPLQRLHVVRVTRSARPTGTTSPRPSPRACGPSRRGSGGQYRMRMRRNLDLQIFTRRRKVL